MEYLENLALPEVKAELVEESDRLSIPRELPEVKAEIVEEYDPLNIRAYHGVNFGFYKGSPFSDIRDLMLMPDGTLILDKNRYFLRGKKVNRITGIHPTQAEEALALTIAALTPYNKGKLTNFINRNKNKPKSGLCLLISFSNPSDRSLGMISPTIQSVSKRVKLE